MSMPSVSVVLPVHNRDAYLRGAIGSITAQTLTDFELIIVDDDSSNPMVKEIISDAERNDGRIRVIHHQKNRGLAGARNTGIAEARASLIALMDDDDISRNNRLMVQQEYLSSHPDIVAVGTGLIQINSRGRRRWLKKRPAVTQATSQGLLPEETSLELAQSLNVNPTSMVRKSALQEVGGYREWFRRRQDIDLTFRIMDRMPMALIADRLYLYRVHRDELRFSLMPDTWDYYSAAVFSRWCRRNRIPDPVEDSVDLSEILRRLGELDGSTRRHLIWKARGIMRRQIQADNLENFVQIREKVRTLVRDDDDNKAFDRVLRISAHWVLLFCRPQFWKEVRGQSNALSDPCH